MLQHFLYYRVVKLSIHNAGRIRFLLGVHTTATSEFWDAEAERCRVPGQPGLQRESQASLSFLVRICLTRQKDRQRERWTEREMDRQRDGQTPTLRGERERQRQRAIFQSF